MEYDELNRLKKTTQDPGGLDLVTETTRFDENGNPEVVVDPKGQTITIDLRRAEPAEDEEPTPSPRTTPLRPWRYTASLEYAYDPNGNLLHDRRARRERHRARPTRRSITTRTYDGLDRLDERDASRCPTAGAGRSPTATTGTAPARPSPTPTGRVTRYTYDGQNRLQTPTTDFGTADARTTTYAYWPDDLLHTVTYPERRRGDPRLRQGRPPAVDRQRQGRHDHLVLPVLRHRPGHRPPGLLRRERQPPDPGRDERRPRPRRRPTPTTTSTAWRRSRYPVDTAYPAGPRGKLRLRRGREPDPRDGEGLGRRRPCGQARGL